MAGKSFVDRLEQLIRLEGARKVAEEIKCLHADGHNYLMRIRKLESGNRNLISRVSKLEKIIENNKGVLGG